jgi:hypothetical protein
MFETAGPKAADGTGAYVETGPGMNCAHDIARNMKAIRMYTSKGHMVGNSHKR